MLNIIIDSNTRALCSFKSLNHQENKLERQV